MIPFGEPVRYLTDDRDYPVEKQRELVIMPGGNGDWYVATEQPGQRILQAVRLSTSGGASSAFPGVTGGIADAYHALRGERYRDPMVAEKWMVIKTGDGEAAQIVTGTRGEMESVYARLKTNWTEVYLCPIIRGPIEP